MRKIIRYSKTIAVLWLVTTVWPVVSIPLHFLITEHHTCLRDSGRGGSLLTAEKHKCAICSFKFCWKFPTPKKFILQKTEIRILGNVGLPVIPPHKAEQHLILLRGPPMQFFDT